MDKKTNTPTESQVRTLTSDWLRNLDRAADFTHRGTGGIMARGRGGAAGYLLGDTSSMGTLELMKASRIAARNVLSSIVNEPVEVRVGGGDSFHTTGGGRHEVQLATDYFDDNSLTPEEKGGIMLGLAAHEGAHGAYTVEKDMQEGMKGEPPQTAELKHQVWNILEDERIEYLLGENNPGLAPLLGCVKRYYYKKLVNAVKDKGAMPSEPLPRFLSTLAQAIRYPSEMTEDQIREDFDDLDAVRKILTPFPLDSVDCWKAAARIMDLIRKKVKDDLKQQQQNQGPGQQAQSGKDDSGQDGNGSSGKQDDKKQDGEKPDGGKGKDSKRPGSNPTGKQVNDEIARRLATAQGKKVMEAIKEDDRKSASEKHTSAAIANRVKESSFVNDDSSEMAGGPGEPRTFVLNPDGDMEQYNASLGRIRAYIPAVSQALACKTHERDYVLHGMKAGKLDTNKFPGLLLGGRNVFIKGGSVKASAASVCLLIDESGSMSGDKLLTARDAAVLVEQTVTRMHNVNFFCYGYTSMMMNVYAEGRRAKPWALGSTSAIGGTPTGDAMKMAAERIRRTTREPVLMLVLTDGCADSSEKVIQQDEDLKRNNFIVIGVGIQSNAVVNTFKENTVITDLSKFASQIGMITRDRLNRMIIRTSSNY